MAYCDWQQQTDKKEKDLEYAVFGGSDSELSDEEPDSE